MTPLRWGIMATGGIARAFADDLHTADLTVSAVASRSQASAETFARQHGVPRAHGSYRALAEDPEIDIIYVATPHPYHAEHARLALENGKHALVEKPFTLNRPQAEALRDLARERGLLVMEAMWTRHLPHMTRIRELVHGGAIGEVRAISADHTQRLSSDPEHRINDLALGGGALLDLAVYPISLAWDLLGAPSAVTAQARFGETGADTEVATIMRHAQGALSTSLSSSRGAGPNTAHIIGSEGRLDIDRIWYTAASFTVSTPEGRVVERFEPEIIGRGMHLQVRAAERYIQQGELDGDVLTLDDSVGIMGTLDEVRAQIGLRYPGEA
ncbi:Gfo/Idh/MocA family oxidoreductase [Nesterenkonia sp. HG001]|uniref:Gfo/Idh/MocA family protein n=1 Tax=Nesterenkonia sp. HG001 TaxID=2983207 RepID=UPI002AC6B44F|nr:Gfo/Idh/MocA family oxidoreductase [Nesterenkonia sp. HG001]MDZ5076160.1 Gfo/Idh/MocA family oxidoreductase [Nesterenkonia sp. HG001]